MPVTTMQTRRPTPPEIDPIMRRPEVQAATGLARSTIYEMMTAGTFPRAVRLGPKAIGWRSSDIRTWLENLPAA